MSFLKLVIQKIGNTHSGSFKNETENDYYKVITKCDRSLLQSASGIKKCDRLLLQKASGVTKCDRLFLQSASCITNYDSYYKGRRNNVYNILKNTKQLYFYLFVGAKLLFDLNF